MDSYAKIAHLFEMYFNDLVNKNNIIKCSPNHTDFLSPTNDLIGQNYKRLDNFYKKSLTGNELDERIFYRDRTLNLTPSKFTPFAKQGYANKQLKNANGGIKLGGNFQPELTIQK